MGTVADGELVAIDDNGRPDFNMLQNSRSESSRIHYYVFDLLCCKGRDLTRLPLIERRALLKSLLAIHDKRTRISDDVEAAPTDLLSAVRKQRLEGIIGKRKDSLYQPGKRSGAWIKYRVNRGQELVIGGYVPGADGLDSIVVGYCKGDRLIYVARVRNGFVPASRRQLFAKLQPLVISKCPFVNLPEAHHRVGSVMEYFSIAYRFSEISFGNCIFHSNRAAGHDFCPQSAAMDQPSQDTLLRQIFKVGTGFTEPRSTQAHGSDLKHSTDKMI